MKAKELKINDWILAGGEPVQMQDVCVENSTLTVYDDKTNKIEEYRYNELMPIPLTSEILEKNGWIYYETQNYWEYTGEFEFTLVYREGKGFTIEQIPYITFQSVHELQHILWALGMDDDLKL